LAQATDFQTRSHTLTAASSTKWNAEAVSKSSTLSSASWERSCPCTCCNASGAVISPVCTQKKPKACRGEHRGMSECTEACQSRAVCWLSYLKLTECRTESHARCTQSTPDPCRHTHRLRSRVHTQPHSYELNNNHLPQARRHSSSPGQRGQSNRLAQARCTPPPPPPTGTSILSPALRLQGNRLSAHAAPMPLRMTRARLTRAHEHARLDRKHRELELAS